MTEDNSSNVAVRPDADHSELQPVTAPARQLPRVLKIARLSDLALIPAIIIIGAIGVYVSKAFLTQKNITNIFQQQSFISLVVLGEAMILIAGRMDLSLESTVGLAPGVAAWLVLPKVPDHGSGLLVSGLWAVPIALGVGAVVGFINGLLIVKFKLHGFIVTLGMLITLRGLLDGISGGQTFFDLPKNMIYLGTHEWFDVPASVWVSLILFAVGIFALGYTRVGRSLYAVGGNPAAAKAAGIRVERVIFGVLILGSVLAALAGIMLSGWLNSVAALQGNGWIFQVFAGAVIGGVSLNGGRGTVFGAFTGILLLYEVQNVLTLGGVGANWIQFLDGVIILCALAVSRLASGKAQTN